MEHKDQDEMITAFNLALDKRNRLDGETHHHHHEFIAELIEARKVKRERWEKIRIQVMGWGIVAALGSIGTAVYHTFVKNGPPHP